jgi:5'-hydroxyaverantin dehydrogenase
VSLLRQALEFLPRNEIDIYVPAAGILSLPTEVAPQDPAGLADLKTPPKDLSAQVINVNLSGVYVGTMLVARYGMGLHKSPEGGPKPTKSIVLIASLAGYCGAEGSVEYTTTKFGVRGLLRGLRKQLAGLGVRLNAVSPFYVDTPMTVHAIPVLKQVGIPVATTEHVTEAVARLATDENAYGEAASSIRAVTVDLLVRQVDRFL